jgi:GNAT superfamily N-acetyltransferase
MSDIIYRRATAADLPHIVALLADDPLGQTRERPGTPLDPSYATAFEAIERDPNQLLVVAVDGNRVIGTFQLTFIPGLGRTGAWRGQIEAVRVAKDRRNERLGEALMLWAVGRCRERGCSLVQLTTDRRRPDAHRFYDRLGFEPTHIGYKLSLD